MCVYIYNFLMHNNTNSEPQHPTSVSMASLFAGLSLKGPLK